MTSDFVAFARPYVTVACMWLPFSIHCSFDRGLV